MYKLKSRRTALGLSQEQLSERSGVNLRVIRAYEADSPTAHKDINKAEALKVLYLADALRCDIRDILEIPTKE